MENYHKGELEVQELAGTRRDAEHLSGMFYSFLPGGSRQYLSEREFVALTWHDSRGRLWITPVSGEPGFVEVVNSRTLLLDLNSSVAPLLEPGLGLDVGTFKNSPVALIAMDFSHRRRMRVNGALASFSQAPLRLVNC